MLLPASPIIKEQQTLKAFVVVTNTGSYEGSGVVQIYTYDLVGSIFKTPGESKAITFNIAPDNLKFCSSELKYDWELCEFEIMTDGNSRDVKVGKVISSVNHHGTTTKSVHNVMILLWHCAVALQFIFTNVFCD